MKNEGEWRLDRRIPLVVIITLALQMASALVWAAQLDARVGNIEQQATTTGDIAVKFARLEERLDNVKQDTTAMKHQLDALTGQLLAR